MDENKDKGSPALAGEKKAGFPLGIAFIFIGILFISYIYFAYGKSVEGISFSGTLALPVLFAFGLITGIHCVGMCGSFMVAYSTKDGQASEDKTLHLKYGAGKLISYTLIGGIFGLIGSVIAFTPEMRGAVGVLAGLFLVIYGLNMLNVFPALRKLQLRLPSFASMESTKGKGPFAIGLANGLFLACGPLQALYIYAAGTGSPLNGALALFAFGLGTLPAMMIFGFSLSSLVKHLHNITRFSGALVLILGLVMANTGLTMLGHGINLAPQVAGNSTLVNSTSNTTEQVQEIRMAVTGSGWSPDTFTLQKGVKVRWIIDAKEITSCNKAIMLPNYLQHISVGNLPSNARIQGSALYLDLQQGQNILEFTPTQSGTYAWSCWMGMIPGTFIVK